MFNWNDLRHFLAVAREGSAGAAARALGVDQSTVNRRLSALEKGLACPLMERQPTGYGLTSHGRQLIPSAEKIEASVHALERKVALLDKRVSGQIRVTCPVTIGHRLMKSGFLDAFHGQHRGVRVELVMDRRVPDLSKGEADIAIRGGRPGNSALIGKKIAAPPWGIYASHTFIEKYGRPSQPGDLDGYKVIGMIDDVEDLPAARWMRLHAPGARIVARSSNIPSVYLAVKSGAGLAPLPMVYVADDGDLECVIGPIREMDYPIYLFAHKDLRRVPRVNAFFEFCLRELKPVLTHGTLRRTPS